jgi:hypothetical protein
MLPGVAGEPVRSSFGGTGFENLVESSIEFCRKRKLFKITC